MPNPDVFFGILQGYGEASHAAAEREYQEEQNRRKAIASWFLAESQNPNRRPESQHQMASNYLRVVQTPGHKKLDKDLQNISIEDISKANVSPTVGSPLWQGGETTRGIPAENMPIPSSFPGAAPQPAQTGPLPGQGIAPPPVAPPSTSTAPVSGTTTPPPSTFQAPVPSPPPGFKMQVPAEYTPQEIYKQTEAKAEATGRGAMAAKLAEVDELVKRSNGQITYEEAATALGVKPPKPPTPPKEPTPRLGKPVEGKVDGQPTQATWNNIAGKWINTDTGQEITGFVPDLQIKNKQWRDRYDDKTNHIYREYFSGDDPSKVVHTADLGISLRAMGQTARQEQMLQYRDPESGQWIIGVIDKATRHIRPATLEESGQSAVGTGPPTPGAAPPPTPPKAEPQKVSGTAAKLTGTVANRAVAGTSIEKIVPDLIAQIQANKAKLGALKGRVSNFLLDKGIASGASGPELRDLQSSLTSIAPLLSTLHQGRPTEYTIKEFQRSAGRMTEDPDNAIAALRAQARVAKTIREAQEKELGLPSSTRGFSVESGGKVYTFPSQKALDDFKRAAGIP